MGSNDAAMTESTGNLPALIAARLFAIISMMTTALGPLFVVLELVLSPPAASSFGATGMHMAGGLDSEISFRAVVLMVTAGSGLLLALAARLFARGEPAVRRALHASTAVLVVAVPLGSLIVRGLWYVTGVMAR